MFIIIIIIINVPIFIKQTVVLLNIFAETMIYTGASQ